MINGERSAKAGSHTVMLVSPITGLRRLPVRTEILAASIRSCACPIVLLVRVFRNDVGSSCPQRGNLIRVGPQGRFESLAYAWNGRKVPYLHMGETGSNLDTTSASQFPGTRWSVVLQVQASDPAQAEQAMEEICRRYWYPIYAFLRKKGRTAADAEDLTQGFFQRILTSETLHRVRQERGKLRTFLLADLKRFLVDESRRDNALKRGGGTRVIPIDQASAESRYADCFTDFGKDPEALFERAWASNLFSGVMDSLAEKYARSGKGELFEALRDSIAGGNTGATYGQLSERLGLTPGALRLQVMRMRHAFKATLEQEIGETVETPAEVRDELRHLLGLLRG